MKVFIIISVVITSLFIVSKNTSTDVEFTDIQDTKLKESIKRGADLYSDFCVTCHLPTGKGVDGAFPPLAKSDFLMENREASIRSVKYGQRGEITVNGKKYNGFMSRLGLEDDEVADVMNYITNSWGNKNDKMITTEEVSGIKAKRK